MGWVIELFRYPVKSVGGQPLRCVAVDASGVHLDRAWACVDPVDSTLGSAKHPRRWGQLLAARAWAEDDSDDIGSDEDVQIEALGRRALAGSVEADELLTELLRRPVGLTRTVPHQARIHRRLPDQAGMVPEWLADKHPGQDLVSDVAGAIPGGRFVDYGAVHVVTTGSLAELARQLSRPEVEAARFRPNLVLDAAADPDPGQLLRIGDVVLRVTLPTPRCVVPGLPLAAGADASGEEGVDSELLATLARRHRRPVGEMGRAACFGVYADVVRPGHLEVGQRVEAPAS